MPETEPKNSVPALSVTAGSESYQQADPKGLQKLVVEDHVDIMGVAELEFNGTAGASCFKIKIGDKVEVGVGAGSGKLFVGFVTGFRYRFIKGNETFTVIALDPTVKLAMSRTTKHYLDKTDSDVITAVLGDSPITEKTVDSTSVKHKYHLQRNESRLSMVRRLAARHGYQVKVKEGKVEVIKPQLTGDAKPIEKESIEAMNYTFSDREVPSTVVFYGWDYVTKKQIKGEADQSKVTAIGSGDNAAKKTGPIFQGPLHVSDVFVDSEALAKEMATAELDQLARSLVRGTAILAGDGSLSAGERVKFPSMAGYGPDAYIVASRHVIHHKAGFKTEITFVSNTWPKI